MFEVGSIEFRRMVNFIIAVSCKNYRAMVDSLKSTKWYKTSSCKYDYIKVLELEAKVMEDIKSS